MPRTNVSNDFYLTENRYQEQMDRLVLPYLDALRQEGVFYHNDHKIAYHAYTAESFSATIVVSHGFAERKEKYHEAIYYFLKMGYQVFILDHFGHGESIDKNQDPSLIYIEDFDQYVSDLDHFITHIVNEQAGEDPVILYGHSMGGCIAALMAQQYPDDIDGLILTSPMFSINTVIPQSIGTQVTKLSFLLKSEMNYVLGFRPFNPEKDQEFNPKKVATSSDDRGEYAFTANLSYSETPAWGPSWSWLYESLIASEKVVQKENIQKINVPILLFQAEKDWIVLPDGQQKFADAADDIEFLLMGDASHEIYLEKDAIVWTYFDRINDYIERVKQAHDQSKD